MPVRTILTTFFLAAIIAACGGGGGESTVPKAQPAEETSEDIGGHVVHFNAQGTDALTPDIARAYDIVRSKNRAMLTVSVIEKASNQPVAAAVSVKTQNLTGQLKNVAMREIREPGDVEAIYYIGETSIANQEVLIFDISVTPEGSSTASTVRFQRQFYTD